MSFQTHALVRDAAQLSAERIKLTLHISKLLPDFAMPASQLSLPSFMVRLRLLHRRDVLGRAGDIDRERLFCGLVRQLAVQTIGLDRRVRYMHSRPRWMEEVAKTSTRIEVTVMVV
jgi:hypothetical protein